MTLLLTEITDKGIVFAADRNLSWFDEATNQIGGLACQRKKILGLEDLSAAIGYFGNAHVGRSKALMDEWLETFIRGSSECESLEELAFRLGDSIETDLTVEQKRRGLGFHLAGYVEQEDHTLPTFWHVSNIRGMEGPLYVGIRDTFRVSEHFLQRDVKFVKPGLLHEYLRTHGAQVYRNGTLAPYVIVAGHIYSLFRTIWALRQEWALDEFQPPSTLGEHASLARFHIELTTRIYELFSKSEARPIGGGVDVITISPNSRLTYDYSESGSDVV